MAAFEHATDVGAIDGHAMHAEADEATRELVHDHDHPVAPEHDSLASREVHTPQAVGCVPDDNHEGHYPPGTLLEDDGAAVAGVGNLRPRISPGRPRIRAAC